MTIPVIVLAAGEASRMGRAKQLLTINDTTLLRRAVKEAWRVSSVAPIVVIGARAEAMRNDLEGEEVLVVENPSWATGMGSSVASGVARLQVEYPAAQACLIMLVDQPFVDHTVLRRLLAAWKKEHAPLVTAAYNETLGVPSLFASALFPELLQLRGQRGAKPVLRDHAEALHAVPCPEAALDLDTPEDWARFQEKWDS